MKNKFKLTPSYMLSVIFTLTWLMQSAIVGAEIYRANMYFRMILSAYIVIRAVCLDLKMFKQDQVRFVLLVYCTVMVMATGIATRNMSITIQCLGVALGYLSAFLLWDRHSEIKRMRTFTGFYHCIGILVTINFVTALFKPEGLVMNSDNTAGVFLTGGKFSVLYLNLLFLVLFSVRALYQKDQWYFVKCICISGLASFEMFYIGCTSGIVVNFIFIFASFLHVKKKNAKKFVISMLLFFTVLAYLILYQRIIDKIPILSHFIYEVLGKTISFDGRYRVYSNLGNLMKGHMIFGYGYANDYIFRYLKISNAQNGFLDIWETYGLLGMTTFIVLIISVFYRSIKNSHSVKEIRLIIAVLMVYLFMAVHEIPFNHIFFMSVSVLYSSAYNIKNIISKKK